MTIPQKLGKYEIRRELGSGAMGVVYEGWDPGIARRVAIKTVKRDQLDRSESTEILARFQREAQAAGRLSHPNIVSIFEYGEDDGTAFIAMEFIEGRELKDYFDDNERFKLPEIGRIMAELLAALGHAHQNGITHRDIKPANIILLKNGTVKVADFGIARIESSNLTQAGAVLGTPAYMSPEQFMGQTVDGRSDLFSAAVILYQFLTGDKPFTGTLTTIMHKVLKEEPPAPSELNVQVPRQFDALMVQALAKRPEERFQTAQEFAAAIVAAMQNKSTAGTEATLMGAGDATLTGAPIPPPTAAKPTVRATSTPVAGPAPPAAPASPAASTVKPTSKMPMLAIAGVAAVAIAGGAVFMMKGSASGTAAGGTEQAAVSSAPTAVADSGTLSITAVGYADPSDPRYAKDQGLMQADLREDARRQLIEKAAALYIEQNSLAQNYGLIQTKLLANSGSFISAIREEQTPQQGKDGLVSMTAKATVNIRQVQKSLNQMSAEERVDFIRNNGDPKISVAINAKSAQTASDPSAPAARSPVAENLLKERIKSFGFRLMNDDQGGNADFAVTGEAKFKKLSHTLEASGITIEKFVLTSWTVKCTDKKSSEEIYYNTQIPEKQSWATEEQAMRDVGKLIGEEFSKNFFLQHFHFVGQKVALKLQGLANKDVAQSLLREFTGLRPVLSIELAGTSGSEARYNAEISGGLVDPADLVAKGLVAPLNQKFGKTCLNVTGKSGNEVTLAFEASCNTPETLGKLDTLPAAALMTAPPPRRESVIRNAEKLKRISI
jgi:tRNA A-37 threonylcarbamoyl transferase component Bud32